MDTPNCKEMSLFCSHMCSYNTVSNTWKMGRMKSGRKRFCRSTFRRGWTRGASTLFSYDSLGFVLLCVLASLEFGNKATEAVPEHARERRLLLDILLKECDRIFPQDPSKAGLQSPPPSFPLTFEPMDGKRKGWRGRLSNPPSEWEWGQFPQSKYPLEGGKETNWTKLGLY